MNTKEENTPDLSGELRARCPDWMKQSIDELARHRMLGAADIVREAVSEYINRHQKKRKAA